jgi:hypothetical protein
MAEIPSRYDALRTLRRKGDALLIGPKSLRAPGTVDERGWLDCAVRIVHGGIGVDWSDRRTAPCASSAPSNPFAHEWMLIDRENPNRRVAGAHDTSPRARAGIAEANSRDSQERFVDVA